MGLSEHLPGFQTGHGWSAAADEGFVGHFSLPRKRFADKLFQTIVLKKSRVGIHAMTSCAAADVITIYRQFLIL